MVKSTSNILVTQCVATPTGELMQRIIRFPIPYHYLDTFRNYTDAQFRTVCFCLVEHLNTLDCPFEPMYIEPQRLIDLHEDRVSEVFKQGIRFIEHYQDNFSTIVMLKHSTNIQLWHAKEALVNC